MSGYNPAGVETSKPVALTQPPVTVTAASTGSLPLPQGNPCGCAVVSNVSPWPASVNTGNGVVTLQPYTADLLTPTSVGFPFTMSVPPGGSATPAAGALTYLQADFYAAGGGRPSGTYPLALTGQAVTAAIEGAVATSTEQFLAASNVAVGPGGVVTVVDFATASYPAGLGAANFLSALVQIHGTAEIDCSVYLYDNDASVVWAIDLLSSAIFHLAAAIIPLAGVTTSSPDHPILQIGNGDSVNGVTVTVTLFQQPQTPMTDYQGIAGSNPSGLVTEVAGTDGTAVRELHTDTSGNLILGLPAHNLPVSVVAPTSTDSATSSGVSLGAPGSTAFGPSTAGTIIKGLSIEIGAATVTTGGFVSIEDTGTGHNLWQTYLSAAGHVSVPIDLGPAGYAITGQLAVVIGTSLVATGNAVASVRY